MANPLLPNDLDAYLNGDSSPERRKRVEAWLQADPAHQELFFQQLEARERRDLWVDARTEAELNRLQHILYPDFQELPQKSVVRPLYQVRWWVVAAASVVLLLLVGYSFRDTLLYKDYTAGYGQIQRIRLADGSQIELNANSSLRVSRFAQWQTVRRVELTGEGFFSVVHTIDHRPFVVQLPSGTQVDVLGTEFSISSRHEHTKVVLKRGAVRLTYEQQHAAQQRTLKPGEWVELGRSGKVQTGQTTQPDRLMAWRNYQFVFEHTSLTQVVRQLHDRFGIQIVIADPTIASRTITGVIEAHTADELLNAIQRLIPIRLERQHQQIVIYPNSKT